MSILRRPSASGAGYAGWFLLSVLATIIIVSGCGPTDDVIDVRDIDDSAIPQAIKDQLYHDPGPIISRYDPQNPAQPNPNFPSGKVVVIPFETPDYPRNPAVTTGYISSLFFPVGQLSGVSVAQYFRENSWGEFLVSSGGVADWVTLHNNLTSYVGFEGDDDLPRDVLQQADINWPALDTNNDNIVTPVEAQLVFLVSNGYSAATRGFRDWATGEGVPLSSLEVNTPSGLFQFRPQVIYIGTKTAADPDGDSNAIRIHATICHELGHVFFNLPDRYAAGLCGTGAAGLYDLMSGCGWHHMNIHDKMKIGWIQPTIITGHYGEAVSFPAVESNPAALLLLRSASVTDTLLTNEYWLVENRNRASSDCDGCLLYHPNEGVFDAGNPESGLAVWWVGQGGWSSGHDDVRLVDAGVPDQDPDGTTDITGPDPGYHDQGAGALFKRDDADPQKLLMTRNGEWSFLYFRDVSDPGSTMEAEF